MSAAETTVADEHNYDPIALTESFASAADKGAKLLGDFLARHAAGGPSVVADEFGLTKAFLEVAAKIMSNPYRLAETQMNLWWDYSTLWQSSMLKLMGQSAAPVAEPAKSDKRFRHEDWQEHFLFDYVKQSYLIAARWLHNAVASVEGLDEHTQKKVDFFTRQYIDAVAPSNFALTSPEVFRETISTGGQNLVRAKQPPRRHRARQRQAQNLDDRQQGL
jgi:polyhydroxyalkanoate synthase